MVDLILTSNIPVTTICRGYVMSAATLLFSCGVRRVIGPHASVMIHAVSTTGMEGRLADVKIETQEMQRLTDVMAEIMAENTGKRKDFYKKQLVKNTDIFLSPTDALKCNLATHIGDARLNTKVIVNTSIDIVPYKKRKR